MDSSACGSCLLGLNISVEGWTDWSAFMNQKPGRDCSHPLSMSRSRKALISSGVGIGSHWMAALAMSSMCNIDCSLKARRIATSNGKYSFLGRDFLTGKSATVADLISEVTSVFLLLLRGMMSAFLAVTAALTNAQQKAVTLSTPGIIRVVYLSRVRVRFR